MSEPAMKAPAAGPEAGRTPPLTAHTIAVRRTNRIAKGFIWGAAGITLTMLLLIVGYIVINGLYTRSRHAEEVMPSVETRVMLNNPGAEDFSVLANRSLRLDSIEYDSLREMYLGLNSFWGFLTGQRRNATPLIYDNDALVRNVSRYLFGESDGFAPSVRRVRSRDEMLRALEADPGAIAIVPGSWSREDGQYRVVGVRQDSIVVHPDVIALQAGRRLDSLTVEELTALFSGTVASWGEVDGPGIEVEPANLSQNDPGVYEPLPVVPIVFSEEVPRAITSAQDGVLENIEVTEDAVYVDSVEAFDRAIRQTPGAVGLMRRDQVLARELDVVEAEYTTHSVNLRPSFFVEPPSRAGEVGGISTIILNTIVMVVFVLIIATPIGLAAAVYLVEYAKQGKFLTVLRVGTDTLAGVPSIIFGLFGLVFFSQFLGLQTGLLSGTFTLTLMILPTIVRTSEEALRSVPDAFREGSLALGGTKLQTIARVVVPSAAPGILTGVILGIGRAVGETAALLFTMGSNLAVVRSLNSPIRVLSVHLYLLIRENISIPNAFATATILVIIVLLVNFATRRLVSRMNRLGAT